MLPSEPAPSVDIPLAPRQRRGSDLAAQACFYHTAREGGDRLRFYSVTKVLDALDGKDKTNETLPTLCLKAVS